MTDCLFCLRLRGGFVNLVANLFVPLLATEVVKDEMSDPGEDVFTKRGGVFFVGREASTDPHL